MSGKKYRTPEIWEKILTQTKSSIPPSPPPPKKSHGQPNKGWEKRRIWYLSKCHPSTKWLARVHQVVVFKTKVLYFKIENTPIKDPNGMRKFKRMLSFLSVDKRQLFAMKLSSQEFNLVFFPADQSVWLVLNQPRHRGF